MEYGFWMAFCNKSECSNETAKVCSSGFSSIADPYSCINHALIICIDIMLLWICLFFFIYKLSTRKITSPSESQKLPLKLIYSIIYNGLLGLAYFGLGISIVSKKVHKDHSVLPLHKWLVLLFHGFTWLLLALTISLNKLHLPHSRTLKFCYIVIIYVVFVCISSLRKAILENIVSIKMILDILSFPGTILFLLCAFQGHGHANTDVDNGRDDSQVVLQGHGSNDKVTPFAEAGFFSNVSFWWLNPLMKKGKERILENKDIPQLRLADQARTCYSIFMKQKGSSESHSLLSVILLCQWKAILASGFLALIKVLTLSASPLFLREFIKVASGKETIKYEAYVLTGGLFLAKCLESLSERHWFFRTRLIGLQVRSMLSAAIYQKQLRLSNAAKMTFSPVPIVTFWACYFLKVTLDASNAFTFLASLQIAQGQIRLIPEEYVLGALSSKTVLLVTHQVDFLPAFNLILLMAGGEILEAATYDKLMASTPEFQDLVNAHKNTYGSERHFEFASSTKPVTSEGEIEKINVEQQLNTPIGDQLIKKEEREIGDTGLKPYLQYLRHKKGISCFSWQAVLLALFVIGQLIQIYWLAAHIQNSLVSRVKLITGFSLIGCIFPVLLLLRSYLIVALGCNTSESIFSTLLSSLFRAPMSFYDSTPLGRILSRVSSDMSTIDIELAFRLAGAVTAYVNSYTSFVILAILAWPVLFIIIPMIYLTIYIQMYYLSSTKELMRMNGTTKSSLASYLAESIAGATTIRAFGEEDGFFSKSLRLIDENACQYFHSSSADEWLIQRLEILCAIVLSSLALVMTLLPLVPSASASGLIGMALSYGLSLNVFLIYGIQNHCLLANFIVSVERLEQYMHIPSEAQTVVEGRRPALDWPAIGKVEIYNLKVLGKCHLREVIQEKEEGLDSLGELVEYDEPVKLINKEGSLFGQLVKDYLSHTTNYAQ
ncbi:hypothetical protein Dsin_007840 [Dipteronia sinensis]|uniref:ABC-type xenobiotic transporter n=1 Tax=Dipteronia sinensis TaxID=43782 RepID=A0AAE0EGV3_9ROSI|nr:hypothetical protein Dsin_007840 [Dipteronia sinensis]